MASGGDWMVWVRLSNGQREIGSKRQDEKLKKGEREWK